MNRIPAVIKSINRHEGVSIIHFDAYGQAMQMMALETDDSLKAGSEVILGAKASGIALAKPPLGKLSIMNRLNTIILEVDNGKLLSSVKLRFGDITLESIITLDSSRRLDLNEDDTVIALVKSSELSILESR